MAAKMWIPFPRVEGAASRQAHADLPAGTFEREMGQEGFFGPAVQFHHANPPTGWSEFEGPLRPRAYDLNRLNEAAESPWDAPVVLSNKATSLRFWRLGAAMPALARNADGDQLLFIHAGAGSLFCDWGHLAYEAGDYIVLPRGSMWRLEALTPSPLSAGARLTGGGRPTSYPHPQPLSLPPCAGRGEPIRVGRARTGCAEARVDVLSAELASEVAAKSPSPCAQGEGLGVGLMRE